MVANVNAAMSHVITAEAEAAASVALYQATGSLWSAFFGDPNANPAIKGLYKTILQNSTFDAYPPYAFPSAATDNAAAYAAAKVLYDASHPTGSPGAGAFPSSASMATAQKLASSLGYTGPPLPA